MKLLYNSYIMNCEGCNAVDTTTLQCPLCEATGVTEVGFFCTQLCFKKHWMKHRDKYHPSGVVKEDSEVKLHKQQAITKTSNRSMPKKLTPNILETHTSTYTQILPSDFENQKLGISPPLKVTGPYTLIQIGSSPSCIPTLKQLYTVLDTCLHSSVPSRHKVVICGSIWTVSAVAWMVRCLSCDVSLILPGDTYQFPLPGIRDTQPILIHQQVLISAKDTQMINLSNSVICVTPDCTIDYNLLTSYASVSIIHFTYCSSTAVFKVDEEPHEGRIEIENEKVLAAHISDPSHNLLYSYLYNGNIRLFAKQFMEVYSISKQNALSTFYNSLYSHNGAYNGTHIEYHHCVAAILKAIAILAIAELQKGQHRVAITAIVERIIQVLGRIEPITSNHNVFLKAVLMFVYPYLEHHCVNQLSTMWNVTVVIPGLEEASPFVSRLGVILSRLRRLYTPTQCSGAYGNRSVVGEVFSTFAGCLMVVMNVETLIDTFTVSDMEQLTCWKSSSLLECELGTLPYFLWQCNLIRLSTVASTNDTYREHIKARYSGMRKFEEYSPYIRDIQFKLSVTHKANATVQSWIPSALSIPVGNDKLKRKSDLWSMALDEVLGAIPPKFIPVYLGDISQCIGPWTKFNARYDGVLPVTLKLFLEANSDKLSVIKDIVMRLDEGKPGASLHYNTSRNDMESEDEWEERSKKQKITKALQGLGLSELSAKTRKKVITNRKERTKLKKKLINARHFDTNRKKFDPSTKVPGYVKPSLVAVKGRGKKANIRRFKR